MADMNDWKIVGPVIAAIVALYGFLLKHLANTDRHASKKDIVYKDVCFVERKRIEDCMEGAFNLLKERTESLEKAVLAANENMAKNIEDVKQMLDRILDG